MKTEDRCSSVIAGIRCELEKQHPIDVPHQAAATSVIAAMQARASERAGGPQVDVGEVAMARAEGVREGMEHAAEIAERIEWDVYQSGEIGHAIRAAIGAVAR